MSSFIQIFRKWILRLAAAFALVLILAAAWVFTHKGEIIDILKKGLNERLQAPVDIAEIDIDFWAAFPKVSLKLTNVYSAGYKSEAGDTLIHMQQVYLAANAWKLFQGEYRVEKLVLENGSLRIHHAGDNSNYMIWKSDTESHSAVQFEISEVVLKKVDFLYQDVDIRTATFVDKGNLELYLSDSNNGVSYDLNLSGLRYQSEPYNVNFKESWKGIGQVNWVEVDYTIQLIGVKLPWMDITGEIDVKQVEGLALSLHGKIEHPENALNNLVPEYNSWLREYGLLGQLNYKLLWMEKSALPLTLSISLRDGQLHARELRSTLSELQFDAEISGNPEKMSSFEIRLKNGAFEMSGQKASFSGVMRNPKRPLLQFKADLSASMPDLQAFLAWPMVKFESGQGKLNVEFSHQFSNWPPNKAGDFKGADIQGTFLLSQADFSLEGLTESFSNTEARFYFDQQKLVAEHLEGKVGNSDFHGSGYLDQFFNYLFADGKLKMVSDIRFGNLDLLPFFTGSSDNSDFEMPDYLYADLRLHADKLSFSNFLASEVDVRIWQNPESITAEISSMKSCGGFGIGTVNLSRESNGFQLKVNSTLQNIDMPQLLLAFDHFGQTTFTSENMKGRANAQIAFVDRLDAGLNPLLDKIECTASLKISNGQLIDFEPLNSLSDYISLEELRDVKFSDLENVIRIKDGLMTIPDMYIQSSALNFTTRGVHDFENNIKYYVKLQMNEVLFRKQVKKQPDLEEHIIVEEHCPSPYLYFKITGDVDNPIVNYDLQGAKRGVKEKWAEEQKTFKTIIKEEFRKDSTKVREKQLDYTIEWDEENNDDPEPDF